MDDTVIVHHGETCSVRLFVLFRETAFSPLPSPTPRRNHRRSIDHGERSARTTRKEMK